MAHFSDQVQFKIFEDMVRLSFRIQDRCVIEHMVSKEDFESILHCTSETWDGVGNVQAKRDSRQVLIRIVGSVGYVHSISPRAFSELCNEYLSRRG